MTKTRLMTLLLTLALALAETQAVMAQAESPATKASPGSEFDTPGLQAWEEEQALLFYEQLEETMLAMGLTRETVEAALANLQWTRGSLSEVERTDLTDAWAAVGLIDQFADGEFAQSDGEEPELGDEEERGDGEGE